MELAHDRTMGEAVDKSFGAIPWITVAGAAEGDAGSTFHVSDGPWTIDR